MSLARNTAAMLCACVVVTGVLVGGLALGLVSIVKAGSGMSQPNPRQKTQLDLRVETAREIRAALEKPQPPIEPLPPITAKAANVHVPKAASRADSRKLSLEARNAMASGDMPAPAPSYSRPTFDRHTNNY